MFRHHAGSGRAHNAFPPPLPSQTWVTTSFAQQTGAFSVEYDVVPYAANLDFLTALCSVSNPTFTDNACVVRFNATGQVDARNGGAYAALVTLNYSANIYYHVRMDVDVNNHTYSAYVTPAGSAEVTIASNYAFRTEQAAVADLDFFTRVNVGTSDAFVLSFALSASLTRAPAAAQLTLTGSALLVPNPIISPAAANVALTSAAPVVSGGGGQTIPTTFNDPIFANVTTFTTVTLTSGQTYTDKSSTTDGAEATIKCNGNNTLTRVRVDSAEAVRVVAGDFLCDSCYFEAQGVAPDHADGLQCYGSGGGTITVKNTCFRSYSNDATAGFYAADNFIATFVFENVLFNGGPYGLRIHADVGGDQQIYLKDVYFVTGSFGNDAFYFLDYGGGACVINQWDNVRWCTIVDGVIVPGDPIAQP